MSRLTELFKTIGTTLHLGELTKPLWEAAIAQVDALEVRVKAIEGALTTSIQGLDPALVSKLQEDWARWQAADKALTLALARAADADAKARAARDAQAAGVNSAGIAQAAAHAAADQTSTSAGALQSAQAETSSGAVASNAVPSPAAQPEAAVAGGPAKDPHAPLIDVAQHKAPIAGVPEPTAAERAGHAPIIEGVVHAGNLTAIGTATSST